MNRSIINASLQQPIGQPDSTLNELKRLQRERIDEKRHLERVEKGISGSST